VKNTINRSSGQIHFAMSKSELTPCWHPGGQTTCPWCMGTGYLTQAVAELIEYYICDQCGSINRQWCGCFEGSPVSESEAVG